MSPGPDSFGRIVVGIDGSAPSLAALEWAARQAGLTDSRLDVVATWDWPTSAGWAVPVPDDFDPEVDVRGGLDQYCSRHAPCSVVVVR